MLLSASILIIISIAAFALQLRGLKLLRQGHKRARIYLASGLCYEVLIAAALIAAPHPPYRVSKASVGEATIIAVLLFLAAVCAAIFVRTVPRPRRIKVAATLGGLYAAFATGRAILGGWAGLFPTWALIVGMPWLPWSVIVEAECRDNDFNSALRRRVNNDMVFPWEAAIARWHARNLIASQCSAWQLMNAEHFLKEGDDDLCIAYELIIMKAIADPDPEVRVLATNGPPYALAVSKNDDTLTAEQVRPYKAGLVAALDDEDREVRGLAAMYLTLLGSEAVEYAPQMFRNLSRGRDGTFNIHCSNMTPWAVAQLASISPSVRDRLFSLARSADGDLGWLSIWIVAMPQVVCRGGKELLFELVKDPDPERAVAAAEKLACSNLDHHETLPVVINFVFTHQVGGKLVGSLYRYEDDELVPYIPDFARFLYSHEQAERSDTVNLFCNFYQNNSFDDTLILPPLKRIASDTRAEDSKYAQLLIDKILERTNPDENP